MTPAGRTERTSGERAARDTATQPSDPGGGLRRATGRDRSEWFAVLDTAGAADRQSREVAAWLTSEHGLSRWWAQKLVVEYEQARGLRVPGVRPDGTFTVTASKTVAVPVARLFRAFVDADERAGWLPGAILHERTSQPHRSVRFDWADGATRVNVVFTGKGDAKSQAAVEHERLRDARAAAEAKAYWQERLTALKILLEGEVGEAPLARSSG